MWPPIYVCNSYKFVPLLPETLIQCATRSKILTEPESDRIGIILDYKPEKVNRIRPDWPDFLPDFLKFNTQLTNHKHKYGSFNFEI